MAASSIVPYRIFRQDGFDYVALLVLSGPYTSMEKVPNSPIHGMASKEFAARRVPAGQSAFSCNRIAKPLQAGYAMCEGGKKAEAKVVAHK